MPKPAKPETNDDADDTDDTVEEWLESLDVDTVNYRDGRYLRGLGAALTALEAAEQQLETAIAQARAAGDSWQAIGVVLGT